MPTFGDPVNLGVKLAAIFSEEAATKLGGSRYRFDCGGGLVDELLGRAS